MSSDVQSKRVVLAVVIAAVFLAVVVAAIALGGDDSDDGNTAANATAAADEVQVFEDLTANHVPGPVEYEQTPPVGGDHADAWQNCGTYPEPIADVNGVHSLEHGAVWITYDPSLSGDDIETLESKAEGETHVLVSPYEGLGDPVVVSAWGRQLRASSADDEAIDRFIAEFQEGEQTPEPGAPCSGALGDPR